MPPPIESISQVVHVPLRAVGILLLKHLGHHDGFFEVSVELGFGVGPIEISPHGKTPGAFIGVIGVGVIPTKVLGPNTLDASVENPILPSSRSSGTNRDQQTRSAKSKVALTKKGKRPTKIDP